MWAPNKRFGACFGSLDGTLVLESFFFLSPTEGLKCFLASKENLIICFGMNKHTLVHVLAPRGDFSGGFFYFGLLRYVFWPPEGHFGMDWWT